MAVFRAPSIKYQALTDAGALGSGYFLYTYAAGTTTLQPSYTSNTGLTENTNPIEMNARGEPPSEIWLSEGVAYKFTLKTAAGVTIWNEDNIRGLNDVSTPDLAEWVASGLTPSYISATSFSVAGDQTAALHVGRRIKTTNTGGTRYGNITSSAFGSGITTVVVSVDSGSLDSGLSAVDLSIFRADNPSIPVHAAKVTTLSASASIRSTLVSNSPGNFGLYMTTTGLRENSAGELCFDRFSGTWAELMHLITTGGFQLNNVTVVPGVPTGGGIIYVEAGALKYKGSSGTVTVLGNA